MRLIINRSYEVPSPKDKFSSPYRVRALLDLTDEEKVLVDQYKLEQHVLTKTQRGSRTTIGDLMRGYDERLDSLDIIIGNEEALRGACASLPGLFAYCRSFGENVVFEYPS
jgi:hypothetical protein